MDCSPPGSSVHGIVQARILKWVAMPSSRRSSRPRDQIHVSCIGRQVIHHWATREALVLSVRDFKSIIKSIASVCFLSQEFQTVSVGCAYLVTHSLKVFGFHPESSSQPLKAAAGLCYSLPDFYFFFFNYERFQICKCGEKGTNGSSGTPRPYNHQCHLLSSPPTFFIMYLLIFGWCVLKKIVRHHIISPVNIQNESLNL